MRTIPFAIPVAWTNWGRFYLHRGRADEEIGNDCLRSRRFIR